MNKLPNKLVILTIRDRFYGKNNERKLKGVVMIWNLHNWYDVQRLQTMAAQDSNIEVRRFEKMALKNYRYFLIKKQN